MYNLVTASWLLLIELTKEHNLLKVYCSCRLKMVNFAVQIFNELNDESFS